MTALDLLIAALATWRIAYFLTKESGPFSLMGRFRERYPLGGMLRCIYCASIWAAIVIYLSLLVFPPFAYVWALSGGAMMLWRYTGGAASEISYG